MADLRQSRFTDGWLIFAAVIMFIVGFHNLIYGIASLRDYAVVVSNLNVTGAGTGVIYADTTFWGWLWIAVGIVEMAIAFGIAAGNELARWLGIVIAALNAIGQLAFLAAFPVWSVVIIAIDILVIYALATYGVRGRAGGAFEPYPGDRPGAGREVRAGARSEARAGVGAAGGYGTDYGPGQGRDSGQGRTEAEYGSGRPEPGRGERDYPGRAHPEQGYADRGGYPGPGGSAAPGSPGRGYGEQGYREPGPGGSGRPGHPGGGLPPDA